MKARPLLTDDDTPRRDTLERMSLWSCAFQNVFASSRRPNTPNVATRPLSFAETCAALSDVAKAKDYRAEAIPVLLRECLAQMLSAGYEPSEGRRRMLFNRIAAKADTPFSRRTRPRGPARHPQRPSKPPRPPQRRMRREPPQDLRVENFLKDYGHRQYGRDPREPWRQPTIEYLAEHPSKEIAYPRPAELVYDGRAYVVEKKILLHCPLAPLAEAIDPTNWCKLGPFFDITEPDKRRQDSNGSWDGTLHEVFRIDWNGWAMERFDVRLRIDYTVTDDLVRADYGLLHDEDEQLLCDDGVVELRRIPGYGDWCEYTSTKSLKFAADFLNVLAPGVLLMEIERAGVGIEARAGQVLRAIRRQARAARKVAPERRVPSASSRRPEQRRR